MNSVFKEKINHLELEIKRIKNEYCLREEKYLLDIELLEKEVRSYRTNAGKAGWVYQRDMDAIALREEMMQQEIDRERSTHEDNADYWAIRESKLMDELEWVGQVAKNLDKINKELLLENSQLKYQLRVNDDDYAYVQKQLKEERADNADMRSELAALEDDNTDLLNEVKALRKDIAKMEVSKENIRVPLKERIIQEADGRFKEENEKLRRQLAAERRSLHAARVNYSKELHARADIESILRSSLAEVQAQMTKESSKLGRNPVDSPVSITKFAFENTSRTLSHLVTQERVLQDVCNKAFKGPPPPPPLTDSAQGMKTPTKKAINASEYCVNIEDLILTVESDNTSTVVDTLPQE